MITSARTPEQWLEELRKDRNFHLRHALQRLGLFLFSVFVAVLSFAVFTVVLDTLGWHVLLAPLVLCTFGAVALSVRSFLRLTGHFAAWRAACREFDRIEIGQELWAEEVRHYKERNVLDEAFLYGELPEELGRSRIKGDFRKEADDE